MQNGISGQENAVPAPRPGWRSWLWRGSACAVLVCAAAFGLGLSQFIAGLDARGPGSVREADGAVALTGGAERITDAVELLSRGYAGRLLITGVNQSTRGAEIARLTPRFADLFGCCIDLGYDALNTRGNAEETRRWVIERGMKSLIVVTSNYHMPRTLIEFADVMPGVTLIPYPVVPERLRAGVLWSDPALLRVLAVEYAKYLRAEARVLLFGPGRAAPPSTMTAGLPDSRPHE